MVKAGTDPHRLRELAAAEDWTSTERILAQVHAAEAAQWLQELSEGDRIRILKSIAPTLAADLLEQLPDEQAAQALGDMEARIAAPIIEEMLTDAGIDLLQDVEPEHAEAILEEVGAERAAVAREMLAHDPESAGGLMQKEFIAIPESGRAEEVVTYLRRHAAEYAAYPATYLYVVDDAGRLVGVVSMRSLLLCDASTPIEKILRRDAQTVPASMSGRELARVFRRYRYLAIPVVGPDGRLLGVVTQDDAMRFAQEEAEEEMLRFTGIAGGDESRDMPFLHRSRHRLAWLTVNIFLNVIAASVISVYEETLRAVITLAVFLPIISDMGGCSGNQAAAVSIRELSTGRIRPGHYLFVLGKELSVGLFNGTVLAVILTLVAWLWKGNLMLGLVVGAALWVNTLVSVLLGGVVPLALRAFKQDPAAAASPILTTCTDVCGFFAVLSLANQVLPHMRVA
jgi:magnesium transporter